MTSTNKENPKQFYDIFLFLCNERDEKPNPVAHRLNISSGTITAWKNGSKPSGEYLTKIADYFDVSIDYLMGRTYIKKPPAVTSEELQIALQNKPLLRELLDRMQRMDDETLEAFAKIVQK